MKLLEKPVKLEKKKQEALRKNQMKNAEKKLPIAASEKPKLPQVFFKMTRERSPNPAKTRLTSKQKEAYEKELKSELLNKSNEIEVKLEKRKKFYESMGIFSGEKNKARVDAARFVAMSKE